MPQQSTLYRPAYEPEIDGLRAFAVLAVIFFHAGFQSLEGGFVGVDVFFVISGYLIGAIVMRSIDDNVFSFGKFYERRIRRILPPLLLTLVATIPFAWAWMMPEPLENFGQSVVAATLSAANVLFHLTVGYFDPGVDYKPLIHTWSLGVEEQFYVVFPVLVWAVHRIAGAHATWAVLLGAWLASFCYAAWVARSSPDPSFFLPGQRFWELLTGVLLAGVAPTVRSHLTAVPAWVLNLLAWATAAGLVLSVVFLNRSYAWPGPWALVPVGLASAAILTFSGTSVGRVFASRPMVKIGLLSYGLYLFHYPVMAFARVRLMEAPSPVLLMAFMVPTTLFAWLSFRYFETPCRQASAVSYRALLLGTFVVAGAMLLFGGAAHFTGGFPQRMSSVEAEILASQRRDVEVIDRVELSSDEITLRVKRFGEGRGDTTLAIMGDSHAGALAGGLLDHASARGWGAEQVDVRGCSRVPSLVFATMPDNRLRACEEFFAGEFKAYLLQRQVSVLVIALRWTYHLWPLDGEVERWSFDNGEGGRESSVRPKQTFAKSPDGRLSLSAADKAAAVQQYLEWLNQLGVPVVVLEPVPEVGWIVPETMVKRRRYGNAKPVTTAYSAYSDRQSWILAQLAETKELPNVRVFPTASVLCDQRPDGRCLAERDGTPLYYDDDHLHGLGVQMLFDALAPMLKDLVGSGVASGSTK